MNKTINKGISRRNFFTGAAAATLTTIVGCNDDKEVTHFQTGSEPSLYDHLSFVNGEGLENSIFIMRYNDRVCVMPEPAAAVESRLHFYESKDSPTGPQNLIKKNDAFVVSRRDSWPLTHVLRYLGREGELLRFRDYATGDYTANIEANDCASIVRGGVAYSVRVDRSNDDLAIDLTGDALFNGKQAPIVDKDGKITLEEDLLLK